MKYIVIELQTAADSTVGNFIFSYTDRNEAESKYHLILASAATSSVPTHSAVLMTNDGRFIEQKAYHHEIEEVNEE